MVMKWTEIQTGRTHSAFQHFMVALGENAEVAVDRINADPEVFTKRLAAYALSGGIEPMTSHQRAREIMGSNFFGVEEAIQHFHINPNRRQLLALSEIPFSEETLLQCKDTHVLLAVFPLSILEIRERTGNSFYKQDWYEGETFAHEHGEAKWQLVRKVIVENSLNKTWDEQQPLIGRDEEVPPAQVMVYTIIGHFLATGERLFRESARTSSVPSGGDHVAVGLFSADGLRVRSYWGDDRYDVVGVASAWKFIEP